MLQRTLVCAALIAGSLAADTVILKNGSTIQGEYLGGDSRRVRIAVGDRVDTVNISEISEIKFGAAATTAGSSGRASTSATAPAKQRNEILKPEPATTPRNAGTGTRAATRQANVEVPAGTTVVVRMIDDVDSERDSVGQTFRASIDEPVVVGAETVIDRGANVVAKLVADKEAGRLSGRTELTLDLVSVEVNGRPVDILTHEVTQAGESRTNRTAKVVGGTAALGAVIGAIAGGGKGAAIGAVSGAAAGGAVQVLTKGQRVRIPSETRLSFTLQQALKP
jgi:hypothetical protein